MHLKTEAKPPHGRGRYPMSINEWETYNVHCRGIQICVVLRGAAPHLDLISVLVDLKCQGFRVKIIRFHTRVKK